VSGPVNCVAGCGGELSNRAWALGLSRRARLPGVNGADCSSVGNSAGFGRASWGVEWGVGRVGATAAVAEAVGWAVVVREGAMEEVAKVAEVETQLGSRRWGPR
jgi:hypothetical protein